MATSDTAAPIWSSFKSYIAPLLSRDDDEELWKIAVDVIYADAMALVQAAADETRICTLLGRCSQWMAPHKAR